MISAIATRIDQTYDLKTRESKNFLVFQLPDGTEVRADIDLPMAEHILSLAPEGTMTGHVSPPDTPEHVEVSPSLFEDETHLSHPGDDGDDGDEDIVTDTRGLKTLSEEPRRYQWRDLPDASLSRTMKTAFHIVGAPEELSAEEIQTLINNIAESFDEEHWEVVHAREKEASGGEAVVAQPIAAKPPQPKPKPSVDQPTWSDGSPIMSGTRPARTVPADDMGYPIVEGGDIDPGEVVAGGDTDEDGVGQL